MILSIMGSGISTSTLSAAHLGQPWYIYIYKYPYFQYYFNLKMNLSMLVGGIWQWNAYT